MSNHHIVHIERNRNLLYKVPTFPTQRKTCWHELKEVTGSVPPEAMICFQGLSCARVLRNVSSWGWNGHATLWDGLCTSAHLRFYWPLIAHIYWYCKKLYSLIHIFPLWILKTTEIFWSTSRYDSKQASDFFFFFFTQLFKFCIHTACYDCDKTLNSSQKENNFNLFHNKIKL